ncbi:hypothetical protein R4P71_28690 [Rhodococcus sp. IEGM 1304]|uniref:hypothetical protein n=1 Tax=Rhodococcus sp. IEGM 1304 TaxID=3082227 RepID=UPI002953E475|nr:hypothetical protein [Rhodococcus sp. IEGM 1304]MDV8128540.1 hypothetical protein [Rhodococcus sp. IEGM 1304]
MSAEKTMGRRWWTSIGAGALLCVGCCLAPLLIAAGILGSGTLLVSLSWLEPLGFALIGLGAAGLAWSRIRARGKGCGADSAGGDGSGCASTSCGCTTAPVEVAKSDI